MAARKRSRTQIARDRVTIAHGYLQGLTQAEIAASLGLSQQQISYDLAAIRAEWAQAATVTIDQAKTEQLARLDHLERVYWQQFRASGTPGEARYLAGVERVIGERCKILGLYAATKVDLGLRALAERAAAESGLSADAVIAEAEAWLRSNPS